MTSPGLAPPRLEPGKYETWKKELKIWQIATSVSVQKQASTVFLGLTGKAREAVLEMELEELGAADGSGMTKLLTKLDGLF